MRNKIIFGGIAICIFLSSCTNPTNTITDKNTLDSAKIVSLNGTLSEILVELGFETNIVGVDVTSTYPESLHQKTKVGHNRTISAEGVLSLQPDIIIGLKKDMKPELLDQFENAGLHVFLFDQEYSTDGTKKLIQAVADSLKRQDKALAIISKLDADLLKAQELTKYLKDQPSVLFIYARGTGTMMVAGEDSQAESVIKLAGGKNAVSGFKDFKPLTAESLVKANPDVILLFDSGYESLGGNSGLLNVPGVKETKAGATKNFVAMDGQFLTGFGPRLGQAVSELALKIHQKQ